MGGRSGVRRRIAFAIAGAAALLSSVAAAPQMLRAAAPSPDPGMIWMISAQALERLAAQPGGGPLVRRFFDAGRHSILVGLPRAYPTPSTALRSTSFASYQAMRAEFGRGGRSLSRVVVLDLEHWPQTPQQEQRSPGLYYRLAGDLARRRGVTLIATPSPNLVQALAGEGPVYERYLKSGLIGTIAASTDVFEVQAQGLERNTGLYASFVAQAADQARDANPKVLVIAGLSTNPGGHAVSPVLLYRDVRATRSVVDGFWLNIPARSSACPRCGVPRPRAAVELLRRLAREKAFHPGAPLQTLQD